MKSVKHTSIAIVLVVGIFWLLAPQLAIGKISVVDDAGNVITLPRPAKRIVSLYGGITEIVCAIGACDQLVGVTKRDSWPPQVRRKTKIGTHMRPNLELILGLKPDLVIQGSARPGSQLVVGKLRMMGIKVALFNPHDLDGLYSTIERIGILTGREKEARGLVNQMQARIKKCQARYPIGNRPKVIFEVSYPSLLFAGRKNIVSDIIYQAGGINVVTKNKKFVRYSLEQLILDDPDVYIVQKGPMNRNVPPPSKRPNFDSLRAVRQGHVLFVDEFLFSRPGPRVVDAIEQLRKYLYEISESSSSSRASKAKEAVN
ncbi:MAG: ABC transporter substrate-binding protein [Thermodesulfobacteria bacterium]|nr:ABC transporter substrate-binding protein [Thermodesulfobacteriota bacterium]